MPKKTFYNLAKEKQAVVMNAAISEFYTQGYDNASISRIVDHAGIAKGSFYQYFEGKEDLFRQILEDASQKKIMYLKKQGGLVESSDIFSLLEILYRAALTFLKEYPKLATISDRFMKGGNQKLKEDILGEGIRQSNLYMKDLLNNAVAKGEIRSDLDLDYTAHLLTTLSISMGDYLRNNSKESDSTLNIDEVQYGQIVRQTIVFLQSGVGERKGLEDSSSDQSK